MALCISTNAEVAARRPNRILFRTPIVLPNTYAQIAAPRRRCPPPNNWMRTSVNIILSSRILLLFNCYISNKCIHLQIHYSVLHIVSGCVRLPPGHLRVASNNSNQSQFVTDELASDRDQLPLTEKPSAASARHVQTNKKTHDDLRWPSPSSFSVRDHSTI